MEAKGEPNAKGSESGRGRIGALLQQADFNQNWIGHVKSLRLNNKRGFPDKLDDKAIVRATKGKINGGGGKNKRKNSRQKKKIWGTTLKASGELRDL